MNTIEAVGADGRPNNMFKFIKAKTAADADGWELKDTSERSGNGRVRNPLWTKELKVCILEKKKENQPWHLTEKL